MDTPKPWLHEGGGRTQFHYQCGGQCAPVFAPEVAPETGENR